MKATTVALSVYALDKTERVFDDISRRAKGVGASGASAWSSFGSVVMKAGAAISGVIGATKTWADEMSALSDIAQMAGMTTEELTKMASALKFLGADVGGPGGIARLIGYMERTTGMRGVKGFEDTIKALSQVKDAAERAQAAQRIFGREAYRLGPIIRGAAENGIEPLQRVMASMQGVSQTAANAGDALSDSFGMAWDGIKTGFSGLVEEMVRTWSGAGLDEDIRATAARASAYFVYWMRRGWREFYAIVDAGVNAVAAVVMNPLQAIMRFMELLGNAVIGVFKGVFELGYQAGMWISGEGFDWDEVGKAFTDDFKEAWDAEDFVEKVTGRKLYIEPDTSDLDAALKKALENADKLSDAFNGAAVGGIDELGESLDNAMGKYKKPDWLGAGTYKAATFTMKPGGDLKDDVKGIRRVLDLINKNNEKIANKDPVEFGVVA